MLQHKHIATRIVEKYTYLYTLCAIVSRKRRFGVDTKQTIETTEYNLLLGIYRTCEHATGCFIRMLKTIALTGHMNCVWLLPRVIEDRTEFIFFLHSHSPLMPFYFLCFAFLHFQFGRVWPIILNCLEISWTYTTTKLIDNELPICKYQYVELLFEYLTLYLILSSWNASLNWMCAEFRSVLFNSMADCSAAQSLTDICAWQRRTPPTELS